VDPWRLTGKAAKTALDRGELTATELLESCLARIAVEDREAFITLCGERALAEARASDKRRASAPRLLEGLPFAVKDLTATAGVRTTYGSRLHVGARGRRTLHRPSAQSRRHSRWQDQYTRVWLRAAHHRSAAPPLTPTTGCLAPADRRPRSRPECCPWPREPTSADRCELPQASAASSACVRPHVVSARSAPPGTDACPVRSWLTDSESESGDGRQRDVRRHRAADGDYAASGHRRERADGA